MLLMMAVIGAFAPALNPVFLSNYAAGRTAHYGYITVHRKNGKGEKEQKSK